MSSNTKLSTFIISLVVAIFIFAAWFSYSKLAETTLDPLQAFPQNTAFVLEIPQARPFFEKLEKDNAFWQDLLKDENSRRFEDFFTKSLEISRKDDKLLQFFNQSFYLSVYSKSPNTSDLLLICKANGLKLQDFNAKLIQKLKAIQFKKATNDSSFASINTSQNHFYLLERKGLIFICSSQSLLKKTEKQLGDKKSLIESPDIERLGKTKGKRADAYLYIDYKYAEKFSKDLPQANVLSLHPTFANYSVLDILLKKKEILLNGYTSAYDSLNQYLSCFKNQKGQKSQLAKSLPYTTKSFISINLSDYSSFIQKQNQIFGLEKQQKKMNQLIHSKTREITSKWWAGEMALVFDAKNREYAVFTAKSGRKAYRMLSDIAHQSQPSIITATYREQKIKQINSSNFLLSQFGSLFANFKHPYFCVIDEAVIFAKSLTDLEAYIDAIILGNNLSKNESYIEFSDNLSDDAVLRIYTKSINPKDPIFQKSGNFGAFLFRSSPYFQKNINGLGLQFSYKNKLFYTGMIVTNGHTKIEKSSNWQVQLDAPIAAGPFLVKNHINKGQNILVQDAFNKLYMLNAKGDIVWSQLLKEPIISRVFNLDYYKNGKYQYLFNTANYMYLIDINGNAVADYPIQLNAEATAGVQVLDYNRTKDYRLLISCKNGEIYNYTSNGRLLKGWHAQNTKKEIGKACTHLIVNKKDYLIFEANNGNIIMTDRRGKKRMEIRKSFSNALGSSIYVNKTNLSKGILLTTDKDGKLVYIPEKGKIRTTSFGKMSSKHYFLYSDFDQDAEMDFIYLNGSKLRIFNKFKKIILAYDFNSDQLLKPQLFQYNHKAYLGVVNQADNQLYLFDTNGLISNQKHPGNTQFVVGKLGENSATSLIIGKGQSLFNYPLN
jgi:L-rhamnose mutarotase